MQCNFCNYIVMFIVDINRFSWNNLFTFIKILNKLTDAGSIDRIPGEEAPPLR